MISVILSLVFVVLLIYLTGIIYAKLNKVGFKALKRQQGDYAKSHVSVVSTTQLGNNKTLHVVELDGKRMLIGASASTIQLIKDLGSINNEEFEYDEYSHIEIPNIKIPKIRNSLNRICKIKTKLIRIWKRLNKKRKMKKRAFLLNLILLRAKIQMSLLTRYFLQLKIMIIRETVERNEHSVDPEEYALYKKYLG